MNRMGMARNFFLLIAVFFSAPVFPSDFSGADTNALSPSAVDETNRSERAGLLEKARRGSDSLLDKRRDEVGLQTTVETSESKRSNAEPRERKTSLSNRINTSDRISQKRSLPLVAPSRAPLSEASGKNLQFQIGNQFQIESAIDLHRVSGPFSYGLRFDLENRENVDTNNVAVSNSDLGRFRIAFDTRAQVKSWDFGLDAAYGIRRQGLFDWLGASASEKYFGRNLLLRPSVEWNPGKLRLRLVSENDLTTASAGSLYNLDTFRTENRFLAEYGPSEVNFGKAELLYEYLRDTETGTNVERHRASVRGEWDFEFFQNFFFEAGAGASAIFRTGSSNTFFFLPKATVSFKKWKSLRFTAGLEAYEEAPFTGAGYLNEPFVFPGFPRETDRGYLFSVEGRGAFEESFQFKARLFLDWAFERNGLRVATNNLRVFAVQGGAVLPGASLAVKLDVRKMILATLEGRYTAMTSPISYLPALELRAGVGVHVEETGTTFRVEDRLRVGEQVERTSGAFQALADRNLLGIKLEQAIGKKILIVFSIRNLLDAADEWTPGVKEFGRTFHLGTDLEF